MGVGRKEGKIRRMLLKRSSKLELEESINVLRELLTCGKRRPKEGIKSRGRSTR